MMATFVGLIIWLMIGKQKKEFDDAAQIPLQDESHLNVATSSNGGNNHE